VCASTEVFLGPQTMFVGKDFLSRKPPPNYKAGVGRGAVGFSTTAERGGLSGFPAKRAKSNPPKLNPQQFSDADEEADAIYAAVESRVHRNTRPNRVLPHKASPELTKPNQEILSTISIDEWATIPEARDITHSHKRLREEEQQLKRHYAIDLGIKDQQGAQERDNNLRKRESLQKMVKRQPFNPMGYIQLARLEEQDLRISAARKIAARGCDRVPQNEELWLLNIHLSSQSNDIILGSRSLELARQAIVSLPHSEKLWIQLIGLEPTGALKLRRVHEALSLPEMMRSEKLWILASDLEADVSAQAEVLETALEFVETPSLFLKLADLKPSVLTRARAKFPHDSGIWIKSLRAEPHLAKEAAQALPRAFWLENLETSDFGPVILPFLQPSSAEFTRLMGNKLNWGYMAESEEICVLLVDANEWLLDEALRLYPQNQSIWKHFLSVRSADELAEKLETVTPPQEIVPIIAPKLKTEFRVQWIKNYKDMSPELWELADQDIDEGLRKWPDHSPFYVAKSREMEQEKAKEYLQGKLSKVSNPAPVWLALAELETSVVRRRAVLTHATAAVPKSSDLWLARINLERNQETPIQYLISEGLFYNPHSGKLWVERLKQSSNKKLELSEALRASNMSKDVLEYGSAYFRSLNLIEKADQWEIMAKK